MVLEYPQGTVAKNEYLRFGNLLHDAPYLTVIIDPSISLPILIVFRDFYIVCVHSLGSGTVYFLLSDQFCVF